MAGEHLHRAKEEIERFREERNKVHLASSVAESQVCIESCAKAVMSVFRVPSKLHDPSEELSEISAELKGRVDERDIEDLRKLTLLASEAAPEHVRATYGDEERRLPRASYTMRKSSKNSSRMLWSPMGSPRDF